MSAWVVRSATSGTICQNGFSFVTILETVLTVLTVNTVDSIYLLLLYLLAVLTEKRQILELILLLYLFTGSFSNGLLCSCWRIKGKKTLKI